MNDDDYVDTRTAIDHLTGPEGSVIRIVPVSGLSEGFYQGRVIERVLFHDLIEAICLAVPNPDDPDTELTQVIRWAEIESLLILSTPTEGPNA